MRVCVHVCACVLCCVASSLQPNRSVDNSVSSCGSVQLDFIFWGLSFEYCCLLFGISNVHVTPVIFLLNSIYFPQISILLASLLLLLA